MPAERSVVVPVPLVDRVAVSIVDVVDVVLVRHGDMAAVAAVLVLMPLMDHVLGSGALVHMILMHPVDVVIVHVVGVIGMRERHMAASVTVDVRMVGVRAVFSRSGHWQRPFSYGITQRHNT